MHWGNFDKFVDAPHLDYSFYQEVSPAQSAEADRFESLDDKHVPEAFETYLQQRDPKRRIFGVIQLTNTHEPYLFDKQSDIWHDSRLTNNYDNSIHYNDRQLGKILASLSSRGMLEDTLIISTSDHGEAFGEHGYYGHLNTFYDEEARVPFWIHLPDKLARSPGVVNALRANVNASVSNADIIPTLMALLAPTHWPELRTSLTDLSGAPLDRPLPETHAVLMQNYNDVDEKTMFIGMGLVIGKYKYLLKFNEAVGEEELYDLDVDPKETHNIWENASMELRETIYSQIMKHKNSRELYNKAFGKKLRPT